MDEHHLVVRKTARYFTIGDLSSETKQIWFVCHGYGQLAFYFARNFEVLEDRRRVIVVPEGLSRFYLNGFSGRIGASWMTREDRGKEMEDYVNYLDDVYKQIHSGVDLANAEIFVLGFSQGTATACRWIRFGNVSANRLILWAGLMPQELDSESELQRFKELKVSLVFGKKDQFASSEVIDNQGSIFRNNKISYEVIRFDGAHEVNSDVLLQLAETKNT